MIKVSTYYNENDPKAAAWLRELIARDLIAPGDVDERSILDVRADDLVGYRQCHFFAGIGGWSYALRLSGWPDDRPVWTGSCPCQPFSVAGKGKGATDERHLWPEFARLIAECSPAIVFGEQVASKAGREWLAGVRADLEAVGYAVGAADLCAAGVGAPHIRQRLYWVADATRTQQNDAWEGVSRERGATLGFNSRGATGGMGKASGEGLAQQRSERRTPCGEGVTGAWQTPVRASAPIDAWSDFGILHCTDGKARRIESGTFPLAHGIPARVGRLRGYGNAIVPQVAAEFIRLALLALDD